MSDGWAMFDVRWLVPLAVGVLCLWAGLRLGAALRRRRRRRASAHGLKMEARAPAALAKRGYRVIERHPSLSIEWWVDGESRTIELAPDLLVARRGRRFLVEVKTGGSARPESRDTRRQLLEYAVCFRADGVLLYDADRDTLRRVEFDLPGRGRSWVPWIVGIAAGAALGVAASMLWLRV